MFTDNFNNDGFYDSFYELKNDCIHDWETIEYCTGLKDQQGNYLPKKKRCVLCGDIIEFGVPANSVKVVYKPPRPHFIPPHVNFFKPHNQHFKVKP